VTFGPLHPDLVGVLDRDQLHQRVSVNGKLALVTAGAVSVAPHEPVTGMSPAGAYCCPGRRVPLRERLEPGAERGGKQRRQAAP
jgi:hypothetical protein